MLVQINFNTFFVSLKNSLSERMCFADIHLYNSMKKLQKYN